MEIRETQVHVLVGCSDARDHVPIHADSIDAVVERYRTQGVDVQFEILRVPGSFVTSDVVADIRRIFDTAQRDPEISGRPIRYSAYVQTHGALEWSGDEAHVVETGDMRIVPGSPVNCGMLGATGVALEVEQLLLSAKLEVEHEGERFRVEDEASIRRMLRKVYGHDGYLAGDWVRSIDDLRTHPRTQALVLERAIWNDPDMRNLGVRVHGGIQDYIRRRHVRVTIKGDEAPFWDDLFKEVHDRSAAFEHEPHDAPKQKPLVGLLTTSELYTPLRRDQAARWYVGHRDVAHTGRLLYSVFVLGGSSFDIEQSRFGPYVITGLYFSAQKLGVKEYLVLGADEAQTRRMLTKVENDPLMKLVVDSCGVNLIPVTVSQLEG